MLSGAQVFGDIICILLSFAGIEYASNEKLAIQNHSVVGEQVALHISVETKSSRYSTGISSSGLPTFAKSAPPKATKFKKWRLSITP